MQLSLRFLIFENWLDKYMQILNEPWDVHVNYSLYLDNHIKNFFGR